MCYHAVNRYTINFRRPHAWLSLKAAWKNIPLAFTGDDVAAETREIAFKVYQNLM
jgi:hypothetical protein